jgi:hypothetical protein
MVLFMPRDVERVRHTGRAQSRYAEIQEEDAWRRTDGGPIVL